VIESRKVVNLTINTFLYDGWNLVSEICNTESESITNRYVWGIDLSGSLQGAGGIGGLLAVTRSTSSNTATYYPCYDANGNISDYVDTNGTVVAHREYDAYGNTVVASGAMVNDFSFWFSTKYLDQETGLYYYGYRYYSAGMGRWLPRDPLGEKGFSNTMLKNILLILDLAKSVRKANELSCYLFVRNSPADQYDLIGLACCKGSGAAFKSDGKCCPFGSSQVADSECDGCRKCLEGIRDQGGHRNRYPGEDPYNNFMRHCTSSCDAANGCGLLCGYAGGWGNEWAGVFGWNDVWANQVGTACSFSSEGSEACCQSHAPSR